jgi:predicted SAM-dependent methyltransferase
MSKKLRLNLGCSVEKLEGYTNVDKFGSPDIKHDLMQPLPYENNKVDEILASHLLEHFDYIDGETVLRDWYRVLKPDGILHIRVPDMLMMCKNYLEADEEWRQKWGIKAFYGGQWNEGEYHHNGFTFDSLVKTVESVGFSLLERQMPRFKDKKFPAFVGDNVIEELNVKFKKVCSKDKEKTLIE